MVVQGLADSILHVCRTLNKFSVAYLIVGGTAVALHGYYRHSTNSAGEIAEKPDLDFWYNPTYENYFRLLSALEEMGQDITGFKEEQSPDPKRSFFRFEYDMFTVDFLPQLKSDLEFRSTFDRRETIVLNYTEIPFISFDDLVTDKKANGRRKDLDDLEQLYNSRMKNKE
jgi:hypothetical protein